MSAKIEREFVTLEVDADTRVGTIRIDRPPMNALAQQVFRELDAVLDEAVVDGGCNALVVWGGPKVFAAGADVKEFPDWTYQDVIGIGVLQETLNKLQRLPM
ncbi:MAG TPA: enoyl-CoA hydratase-related protein, partial [Nitriliruptorales bacterium]